MTLEEFINEINEKEYYTTYIVQLAYRYDWQTDYTISNEILEWEWELNDWLWQNDWNEGQKDVKVCNYVTLDEVFDDYK